MEEKVDEKSDGRYEPIVIERILNVPVEKVWEALTDKEKMKKWYFDLNEFKPEVGFAFQFKGQGHKGEQYLHLCKITDVKKLQRLEYSWEYEGYEGSSLVSFELKDMGGKTKRRLVHKGLHTFPDHPDFIRESFNGGWTQLIGTLLRNYVEN